jgi:hypothetical protein
MKVKLIKSVLVGADNLRPTRAGSTVDVPDDEGKELIAGGMAEAAGDGPDDPVKPAAAPPVIGNGTGTTAGTVHQPIQEATTKK